MKIEGEPEKGRSRSGGMRWSKNAMLISWGVGLWLSLFNVLAGGLDGWVWLIIKVTTLAVFLLGLLSYCHLRLKRRRESAS